MKGVLCFRVQGSREIQPKITTHNTGSYHEEHEWAVKVQLYMRNISKIHIYVCVVLVELDIIKIVRSLFKSCIALNTIAVESL